MQICTVFLKQKQSHHYSWLTRGLWQCIYLRPLKVFSYWSAVFWIFYGQLSVTLSQRHHKKCEGCTLSWVDRPVGLQVTHMFVQGLEWVDTC